MKTALYIAAAEKYSGKSALTVGLYHALDTIADKVGFFKPLSRTSMTGNDIDGDVHLIKTAFNLTCSYKELSPISLSDANNMVTNGKEQDLLDSILESYDSLSAKKDIVLIEGTDFNRESFSDSFDINSEISKTLNSLMLINIRAENKTPQEILSQAARIAASIKENKAELLGFLVNRAPENVGFKLEVEQLFRESDFELFGVLPFKPLLRNPRLSQLVKEFSGTVLGGATNLNHSFDNTIIAAMTLENALVYLKEKTLVITAGDRDDIILGVLMAQLSGDYPLIAGILLTGGIEPSKHVMELISTVNHSKGQINLPIILVDYDTHTTAMKLRSLPAEMDPDDKERLETSYELIDRNVDMEKIYERLSFKRVAKQNPRIFLHGILKRAEQKNKTIVLPEGEEERTLAASAKILQKNTCKIILLGDKDKIHRNAKRVGVKIDKAIIINPKDDPRFDEYAGEYFKLRSHKGITMSQASDTMLDTIYFGTMMVHKGHADGLVSGAIHTTAHTVRPALEIIKCAPGISIVSSVFLMCMEDRVLVYGDCAINPQPNAEQLADIAISSAKTAQLFGIDPKIAMLSYSTGSSGTGPEVEKVIKATEIAQKRAPELLLEGPLQYDAAVDMSVAKIKLPDSKVAGHANVFIFPDLNTGNNTYKAVQRSAGALALGPVLQGLNKPVNDLSRGALVEDIVYTIAITALTAG